MDEVSGDGSAELLDNASIAIEFAYHNGDEAVLKAKRVPAYDPRPEWLNRPGRRTLCPGIP